MPDDRKEWDVAISFASADEAVALQLRELLLPTYSVFVYSKAQEHLAGRDGVEAFRTVFRERASLAVILYAEPWGKTDWTRVEKTAIEEMAMEDWSRLMFVRLRNQPVPKWVPKPHLYLNLTTFSMADLVGAIKMRLAELGVESRVVTTAERAAAYERQRAFDAETERMLAHVPSEFDVATNVLIEAVKAEAESVAASTRWRVESGPGAILGGFIVVAQQKSIQIMSGRRYANSVDDCFLELSEYDTGLVVQKPGFIYHAWERINAVRSRRLWIRRLPELGWCWESPAQLSGFRER